MKIILTYSEALDIIRKQLGLGPNQNIEIGPGFIKDIDASLKCIINEIGKFRCTSDGKIAAIKRLQELSGCSLAESRMMIEDWQGVKLFIEKNNRLPAFCWLPEFK